MTLRRRAAVICASAGMAALMVFAFLPSVAATPAPVEPAQSSTSSWAYGHVLSLTVPSLRTPDGWEYQGSLTIGYIVVVSETNASAGPGTFSLSAYRAEGVHISLEFCRPDCQAPVAYANVSMHAWQKSNAWANFTTNGTVEENGVAVPAIALMNSNSVVKDNLTESTFSAVRLSASGPVVDRSKYLSAALTSEAAVRFAPALGLIPLNLLSLNPASASWSSNSTYAATGSVRAVYYFAFHGPIVGNVTSGPTPVNETFQPSGAVSITGSFASPAGVSIGTLGTFPVLQLSVTGPFSVQEGIILLPSAADFFGSASQPWATSQASDAQAQSAAIDFEPYLDGHLGLVASSRTYSVSSANPAEVSGPGESDALADGPVTANPVATAALQGEPVPLGSVSTTSQCLLTVQVCPSGLSSPRTFLATAVAVVVVAGAAGLIAAVVVVDRRRLPPPSYPNAALYPPGAVTGRASAARPGGAPEPPPEDDPLDHLW